MYFVQIPIGLNPNVAVEKSAVTILTNPTRRLFVYEISLLYRTYSDKFSVSFSSKGDGAKPSELRSALLCPMAPFSVFLIATNLLRSLVVLVVCSIDGQKLLRSPFIVFQ
ncbi:hypothetical protein N7G274_007039 [Stereocaulon virgatum]|uniref:Uncharacterized protein n=1 Tax=Stereocaulon virgatum TaxID=373712 RepID=A0ABR4A467_9LECA